MLERMIASVLPQIDRVFVDLNGYPEVPSCLDDPKVTVPALLRWVAREGATIDSTATLPLADVVERFGHAAVSVVDVPLQLGRSAACREAASPEDPPSAPDLAGHYFLPFEAADLAVSAR